MFNSFSNCWSGRIYAKCLSVQSKLFGWWVLCVKYFETKSESRMRRGQIMGRFILQIHRYKTAYWLLMSKLAFMTLLLINYCGDKNLFSINSSGINSRTSFNREIDFCCRKKSIFVIMGDGYRISNLEVVVLWPSYPNIFIDSKKKIITFAVRFFCKLKIIF